MDTSKIVVIVIGIVFGIPFLLLLSGAFDKGDSVFGDTTYSGGAKRKRGLKLNSNTLCCLVALVAGSLVVLRLVRGEGLL